jgi:hypothetical protein
MPLDYATLKSWPFPDVEHRYTARDTMLYALGLGCGGDTTDPDELPFVFEEGLRALPTMAVVLGGPGFWMRNEKTGVDWRKILHGEQGLTLHRPTPAPHALPDRAPDAALDMATLPQAALIYRLSGDVNPLHADAGLDSRCLILVTRY